MTKTIIFFTAGMFATDEENEKINKLRTEGNVSIQNASAHDPGSKLKPFDQVEGEVPESYKAEADSRAATEAAGDLAALNDLDEEDEEENDEE